MKKRQPASACLLLLAALLFGGCGSFTTWSADFDQMLPKDRGLVRIYSGVLWDLNVMDPSTGIGQPPDEDPETPYFNVLMIFDVPFSLFFDTVVLPWSIYQQAVYGSYRRRGVE
jgi:uncharacterized protein YceK